jgi:hypothetical protein
MPAEKHEGAGGPGVEDPQLGLFAADAVSHLQNPRREFRWTKEARDLVRARANLSPSELSCLFTALEDMSGNPRWACRRFVRSMGLKSKRPQRAWSTAEQQRLLKLLDLHPVQEIAKVLRRSQSSVWHMLQRMGANAKMGTDSFSTYSLAVALHVRPERVQEWIARNWLKVREVESSAGKRVTILAEDFCLFCREHTRDVVGSRLTRERLEFVYHFAFPPSHAELLPVRESKKERGAYQRQSIRAPAGAPPAFAPERAEIVEEDELDRKA